MFGTILLVYWIVTGFAFWVLPDRYEGIKMSTAHNLGKFVGCILVGGLFIPVRIVIKLAY